MSSELAVPSADRQRLLVFNLRTDIDDHILGFTTQWLNALAPYYTAIDVLTTHKGALAVADNIAVYSTGREKGYGRLRQLAEFYNVLSGLLLENKYDACFAHMQPLFASLAAPLLTLRGVKVTTWYTHRQLTRQVQLAEKLSYRVVSAVRSSFPIDTPKLRALGHGIDTTFFTPNDTSKAHPPRIVQVARLTEIKHQHILLDAIVDLPCEVVFVGDIPDGYDDSYKHKLLQQVNDLGITNKVIFAGAQTPEEVVNWYNSATIAVNLSPKGLFDKAALESMACAIPTIVSNPAFGTVTAPNSNLLHINAPDDTDALRETITKLLQLSEDDRLQIGDHLRQGIIDHHSLDALMIKLINVLHTGEVS